MSCRRVGDAVGVQFLQTDPIGYDGGLNWYAYVDNDPLNYTDPSGEQEQQTGCGPNSPWEGCLPPPPPPPEDKPPEDSTPVAPIVVTATVRTYAPAIAGGYAVPLGPSQQITIALPNPAAIGQWAQRLYNEAHDAKGKKGKTLRGGKKSQRDNWYGKNDPNFQRWWHREGKEEFGGNDIDNAAEAQEAWDHWNGLGRPTVK